MANHPSAEHLLSLLHDGDRCLAEARLSLQRSHKLLDIFRQEGGCVFYFMFINEERKLEKRGGLEGIGLCFAREWKVRQRTGGASFKGQSSALAENFMSIVP